MFRSTRLTALTRAAVAASLAGLLWLSCSPDRADLTAPGDEISHLQDALRTAMEVQERHTADLLKIPGVVGTAVGLNAAGQPAVKIYATRNDIRGLPNVLDGLPVEVVVTGMFFALTDPTQRQPRPVPTGVSVGHPQVTAGTIGARVRDASGNVYVMSNNHVLANQNNASIGDPIVQPGAYDGGQAPADQIGTLYDFEPLDFGGGQNTMDAAIALTTDAETGYSTPTDDGYGVPSSTTATAFVGMDVQKYGRTTKLTQGQVSEINTTVTVCYEAILNILCTKSATFKNQFSITPGEFSGGGDSGSLIVRADGSNHTVGLLFAGSQTHTIASPIDNVLNRFNVVIDDAPSVPPTPLTDLAVSEVSGPEEAVTGNTVQIDVRISNVGNQDVVSTFNVTLTDATDGGDIGTQTVNGLAPGGFTVLSFDWNTTGASLGDHTIVATHDFADENSANDTNNTVVPVVEEPPTPAGLHVGDLFPYVSSEGKTWTAYVIVEIHDENHNPVEGAIVQAIWTGNGLEFACDPTDYAGECLTLTTSLRRRSVTFTMENVLFPGMIYDPAANHDLEGDTDGTSITFNKP